MDKIRLKFYIIFSVLPDVLAKQRDNIERIKLNGKSIEVNVNFRIYFITKLTNPEFHHSVFSKLLVINFNITQSTFEKRLLSILVESEQPDWENGLKSLTEEINNNILAIEELESNQLKKLATFDKEILDSPEMISLLEKTKQNISHISNKVDLSKIACAEIASSRGAYMEVSQMGSQLFFIWKSMGAVNRMYQYSIVSFINVFTRALGEAEPHQNISQRLKNIGDKLCGLFYEFGCIGLFEKDKLLYSFQIATIMEHCNGSLDQKEIDFFIKGADYSLDVTLECPFDWITESNWKCIFMLENDFGERFNGIMGHLKEHEMEWRAWFFKQRPDEVDYPGKYHENLSPFEVCLLKSYLYCFI